MQIKQTAFAVVVSAVFFATAGYAAGGPFGSQDQTPTGAAAGANTEGANSQLVRCQAPLGTLAMTEDTNAPWYDILTGQYHLGSTIPVLKLLVQQSNCFVIVDRGRGMQNIMGERQLEAEGQLRGGSGFGNGQMVAADYSMSPSITFNNRNAGGIGAAVGGLFGSIGSAIGGELHAKSAAVILTLDDNRSGVQIAAAEGSAKHWDIGGGAAFFGGFHGGGLGGYTNTAEGKVIVMAFADAYNNMVASLRNYRAQHVAGGLGMGGQLHVQGAATPAGNTENGAAAAPERASDQMPAGMSITEVQQRLGALGYNVGTPDGVLGPGTQRALKAFQRAHDLAPTGALNPATIAALESTNPR